MGNSHIFDEQIDRLFGEVGVTEFYSVLDEAVAFAREICAASNEEFNLGDWERWEMSQDHQKLTLFSDSSANRLSFDIQIVGTFSHESGSWKWSWDNPNIDDQLTSDAKTVKVYGLEHGFDQLCDGQWQGSVDDGWRMSALTLKLAGGIGLYSGDFGSGRIFMLLKTPN